MGGTPGDPDQTDPSKSSDTVVEEWKPTFLISVVWTILGTVLTIAAFFGFNALETVLSGSTDAASQVGIDIEQPRPGETTLTLDLVGLLLLLVLSFVILPIHELFHGLAIRYFGGRPTFGVALLNKVLPVLYCTAPGYLFNRKQFAVVSLAPAVGISLIGIVLMAVTDLGIWLVVPLAINFGGAVGDFWFAGMLLRMPQDTLIEDQKDGLRIHYPSAAS